MDMRLFAEYLYLKAWEFGNVRILPSLNGLSWWDFNKLVSSKSEEPEAHLGCGIFFRKGLASKH